MKSNHRIGAIAFLGVLLVASCSKDEAPTPPPAGKSAKEAPVAPLFKKQEAADWCVEHGVPESVCTRCNDTLIASFKAKGDWCAKHELPASQCITCKPELKAKLEAMAPKKEK